MSIERVAGASGRIEAEAGSFASVRAVLDRVEARPETFVLDLDAAGLDWGVRGEVRGVPNRARVKCWSPKPGRLLVWFYKRSSVPWSRERFSYGGVLLGRESPAAEEIDAWLRYQVGGFHPEERPRGLRRAFPFDLPE